MMWKVVVWMENGARLEGKCEDFEEITEMLDGLERLFGIGKVELFKIEDEDEQKD